MFCDQAFFMVNIKSLHRNLIAVKQKLGILCIPVSLILRNLNPESAALCFLRNLKVALKPAILVKTSPGAPIPKLLKNRQLIKIQLFGRIPQFFRNCHILFDSRLKHR